MDNKTKTVSGLVSAGIITLLLLVPGFFDSPKYFLFNTKENDYKKNCEGF